MAAQYRRAMKSGRVVLARDGSGEADVVKKNERVDAGLYIDAFG